MNTSAFRAIRGIEVREAPKDSKFIGVLEGYAAVFNSDSVPFTGYEKPWVERIAPGAFTRSLREHPDVKALWSHRSDAIIGRAPDTLKIEEDSTGLRVQIMLIDTQQNRDILASVRAKQIDAMSFGFTAKSVRWDEEAERDVRTLLDVTLDEVSPVVWPAYTDTSLSARSAVICTGHTDTEFRTLSTERANHFAESAKARRAADEANQNAIRGMALRFL